MVCCPPLCCPPETGSTLACTVWPGAPGLASTAWEMIWEWEVRGQVGIGNTEIDTFHIIPLRKLALVYHTVQRSVHTDPSEPHCPVDGVHTGPSVPHRPMYNVTHWPYWPQPTCCVAWPCPPPATLLTICWSCWTVTVAGRPLPPGWPCTISWAGRPWGRGRSDIRN